MILCHLLLLAAASPPAELVGQWQGDARILVSWTRQRTLPVRITIAPDDLVSGTIGDAVFHDVKIKRHGRFWTGVLRNTRYTLHGKLKGPVISAENVTRKKAWVLISPVDDCLEGGVNTSGTSGFPYRSPEKLKKKMGLAASGLRLHRVLL